MFSIISSYLVSLSDVHADDNIVGVVNGQKLTRDALSDLLINTFGTEGMDLLIKRTIVRQEARKQKVKVTQEEISKRIDDFIEAEIGTTSNVFHMRSKEIQFFRIEISRFQ